jgi:hypothetical protein
MIKLFRTDEEIKDNLYIILEEKGYAPNKYNLNEMVKDFSQYMEDDFWQYMLDKYKYYIEDGHHQDFENEEV